MRARKMAVALPVAAQSCAAQSHGRRLQAQTQRAGFPPMHCPTHEMRRNDPPHDPAVARAGGLRVGGHQNRRRQQPPPGHARHAIAHAAGQPTDRPPGWLQETGSAGGACPGACAIDSDQGTGNIPMTQRPNSFCFCSRRDCASMVSVAVGRASSRGMPMASPVSSQYP